MNEAARPPVWPAFGVTAVVSALMAYCFRPELGGTPHFWLVFVATYALLGAVSLHILNQRGALVTRFRPHFGDISTGAFVAVLLLVGVFVGRSVLSPRGSETYAWLLALYLQIGDSDTLQRSVVYTLGLVFAGVLEEVVWRGFVLDTLTRRFGTRAGWTLSAALYALAHLPTAFTLRIPGIGYNPLLVLAAFGCGLSWAFLTRLTGRLVPAIVSHVIFTYFVVTQFR
jgi:uncharacterized protein